MIRIRLAEARDMEALDAIFSHARAAIARLGIDQWQDGYPSAELLLEDIRVGRAYVFDDGGAIASITVLTPEPEPIYDAIDGAWHTGAPYLTIHRMALDDAHRHSGLAGDVVKNAVALARSLNLSGVRADTHRGNAAMRRFLEKSGFQECGLVTYPDVAGDPIRVAYDLKL